MLGDIGKIEMIMARGRIRVGQLAARMSHSYPANASNILWRIRTGKPVSNWRMGALAEALGVDVAEILKDAPPAAAAPPVVSAEPVPSTPARRNTRPKRKPAGGGNGRAGKVAA